MLSLAEQITALQQEMQDMRRRLRAQSRMGIVTAVDAQTGKARVELNGQNGSFLSPWMPWEEIAAGKTRTHYPPSIGQQVRIVSTSGDIADATIQTSVNSDAIPRPSNKRDEIVLCEIGKAKIRLSEGGNQIILSVGTVALTLSDDGVTITGGKLRHNGKNIGDTHRHGGVQPGSSDTQSPNQD